MISMPEKSLVETMRLKPGRAVSFVAVPAGVVPLTEVLPAGVARVGEREEADVIFIFVADRAALQAALPGQKARLKPGGALWVGFRKGNISDINRDSVFHIAAGYGLQPAANIAVDDEWSALRLKVVS
jgi:hypothetical protein